jgi:hypothetical protein
VLMTSTLAGAALLEEGCAKHALLDFMYSDQASSDHFPQCAEFLLLRNRGLGPLAVHAALLSEILEWGCLRSVPPQRDRDPSASMACAPGNSWSARCRCPRDHFCRSVRLSWSTT